MSHKKQVYDLCKTHMHSYVLAQLDDGTSFDGIITGLDDDYVYFAIPIDSEATPQLQPYMLDQRQFGYGYPGYGFPGYGFPGYGGFYGRPRRRFNRLVLPLAALTALTLLPWY
ncbi:hypothetical protein [Ornithinibacillus hominis]|uniref:Phosphatidylinositol kinase n=1 Tax=Ornithinibacillus hominis TaxID=2763055 RepID=A0A923L5C9_9BACI|nr:hypothetical protein [Ornithinibacillus hominis]MBC5636685.1 hypothetical protein [Ornithinibacillus hominis]